MSRGSLRVYLGAAPGVGKTYAMLAEGRRRAERGTDVVVGWVDTHDRPRTAEQAEGLEVVPRRRAAHGGVEGEELDVDAVLARRPEVALVDDLAHTNAPGGRNGKRWQDVEELLDAGIDVVTTLDVQHLESVQDVVERITGTAPSETIPDDVVRRADQVELVDMTPEALRRRLAHGNVYPSDRVDAALANAFRVGNLGALRELALLWVADQVDAALGEYRRRHGIHEPWETRERVVVAITGAPGTDHLIRRAARMAQRTHGDLLGVHVRTDERLVGTPTAVLARHQQLLTTLGGTYHETSGRDPAAALLAFARAEDATQLVLGSTERSRVAELARGSVINRVIRRSGPIDVHVISRLGERAETLTRPPARRWSRSALPARRQALAWIVALVGVPLLTLALVEVRDDVELPTVLLLYLVLAVTVAAIGGVLPALFAAVIGFLLANWFFAQPYHELTIGEGENLVALVVFLGVAGTVSVLVDRAARLAHDAGHTRAQAEALARLAATVEEEDPLQRLLDHLRATFDLDGAALLRAGPDGAWTVEAASGRAVPEPSAADATEDIGPGLVLAVTGPRPGADDRRVLDAFVAQLAGLLERRRLRTAAAEATSLARANDLRTALLQAISHDLRTPLTGIKTSVSSLRQDDVVWSPAEVAEFLATIEDEADRLTALVDDLLDMSRIQAGALDSTICPTAVEEVALSALASVGARAGDVRVDVPETLPLVCADPALLERVLANLIANAVAWTGDALPPTVDAGLVGDLVVVRVVDHGPGIAPDQREAVFLPFQRLGDGSPGGVGLGLAVARGLARAQGGDVELDHTPGGGTTAVVTVPVAP